MIEVLVIVPYQELENAYSKAISHIKSKEVNFTTTYLFGTDSKALEIIKKYDIVVVRGMTSYAISKLYPDFHKIEIIINSSDILDALLEAKEKYDNPQIALILSNASICCPEVISKLTGLNLSTFEVFDEEQLSDKVTSLSKEGFDLFIGGLTLKKICKEKGYEYVQIKTGESAINQSIRDALQAAHIMDRERTKSDLVKSLVDSVQNAIFFVNSYKVIIAANRSAENFFKVPTLVGKNATSFYPEALLDMTLVNGSDLEIVQTLFNQNMLVVQTRFVVNGEIRGVMVSLQRVSDIYATEKKIRSKLQAKGLIARANFSNIVTDQFSMRQLIAKALRYAQVDGNVLITGETGTGKELIVQSMHNASQRANGPFVAINCAALSEQLLESELFGYTEGAFTGASKGGKTGLFELAHKGTIFLDEIGEMPIQLQAKLLRVLQEREVRRVGGDEFVPVDVRVMCATNQNIPQLIEKGLFRMDLYYRINLLTLHIPPLRERVSDIGLLFDHFVSIYSSKMNIIKPNINKKAISELEKYRWMGNIRELRNVAERIVVLNGSQEIDAESIRNIDIPDSELLETNERNVSHDLNKKYKKMQNSELFDLYLDSKMSLADFSSHVGISRTTLWRKFKEFSDNRSFN